MSASVFLLGTRGSLPVSGEKFRKYGGATSCILAKINDQYIVLDAGTGLLSLKEYLPDGIQGLTLLLTHAHADHVYGLPGCTLLYEKSCHTNIYAVPRGGLSAKQQACALMRPPLWPVGPEVLRGAAFTDITGPFHIGNVKITYMESDHPGGSSIFRLSDGAHSLVYATDFEHGLRTRELEDFARGCSLLLYDAEYDEVEYGARRGWGHSTWQEGVRLAQAAGVGRLVLVHHAPERTDEALDALGGRLADLPLPCSFGRCGEEIPF